MVPKLLHIFPTVLNLQQVYTSSVNHHGITAWRQLSSSFPTARPWHISNQHGHQQHPIHHFIQHEEKRSTWSTANTIPSFFQQCLLPSLPVTVATATGTGNNHCEAPPNKKGISSLSLSHIPYPTPGPAPPPNLTFTSTWLCIDKIWDHHH